MRKQAAAFWITLAVMAGMVTGVAPMLNMLQSHHPQPVLTMSGSSSFMIAHAGRDGSRRL